MQTRFDLLVTDVMPIYMIMPRYSQVYSHHINLHYFNLALLFYFAFTFYFASLYQKYQKYYLSSLSDLTLVSDREGINNPLSRWLRGVICFVKVRGTRA